MLTMLDLCCGLGGASAPMIERGWKVVRVDIEAWLKPDVVADVRALPFRQLHIDLFWASPPCTEFSKWNLPWWKHQAVPSMELVEACISARDYFAPRFWVVENVMASRQWLTPRLGPPRALCSGHVLWSNLPLLIPNVPIRKEYVGGGKLRPWKSALIPPEIAGRVAATVEAI